MSQMTPTTAHVAATRTAGTYQGGAAARGAGTPGAEAAALMEGMAGLDDPTPDTVPATAFWRPGMPPPAATKHPIPTITGHSCSGSFPKCEIAVHTATTAARLSPRAVIAFIALPPSV